MKLSELRDLPAFVLMGPGFTGAGWLLLRAPRPADPGGGTAVCLVPYGQDPRQATWWSGDPLTASALCMDVEPASVAARPTTTRERHAEGVAEIRRRIACGQVYQVNLTIRAELGQQDPAALVATLCRRGVPRFMAWVRLPGLHVITASPELLFQLTPSGQLRVEPMKGTAAAGRTRDLLASAKDRAELAMITDLMRNDLTPVCLPRSVRVHSARRPLRLPYAVQTVSRVQGRLLPGTGILEVLNALHPAGSITGAPKRTAMEAIADLEDSPRGPYCGTLGLVQDGRATFSVLIRTAWEAPGGWRYGTGGGITSDSNADEEFRELHTKLGALHGPRAT